MFQNVPKCPKMFQNVPKCPKMFQNVPKCPKMSQNVPKCPKMSQNVPKCPKIMRLLGIFLLDLGVAWGVGWIRQVLAHQKQGPRATIGAARRALCYDGAEEPSPGPATYASETKYKAPVVQVCWWCFRWFLRCVWWFYDRTTCGFIGLLMF